jgi:energy-coupling factor transporter ATP-binding protein EcfA2
MSKRTRDDKKTKKDPLGFELDNQRKNRREKQRSAKRVKFTEPIEHPVPQIDSLEDLILMCESDLTYAHIDNMKLYTILPGIRKLASMKGLEEIKKSVLGQILYTMQGLNTGADDYMHTVITGPPGSGKTSLAEILGEIYCHLGVLATGTVVRAHRKDLIGKYCGHTANLTEKVVKSAFGGVLLIDEGYNIGGAPDRVDTFAKECVDTLCGLLSEHKKDFMCIIVGYKDALTDCFFKINPGLERRFAWRYDTGEAQFDLLEGIFNTQALSAGWYVESETIPSGFFSENREYFKTGGGATEVLFAKCKIEYSKRVFGKPTGSSPPTITRSDFMRAFTEYKNNKVTTVVEMKPPPFGMYL